MALADLRLLLLLFLLRANMLRFEPRRAVGGVSVEVFWAGDTVVGWLGTCCDDDVRDGMFTVDDFGFCSVMVSFGWGGEVVAWPAAASEGAEASVEARD